MWVLMWDGGAEDAATTGVVEMRFDGQQLGRGAFDERGSGWDVAGAKGVW
jgi:hypothetical protein